MIVRAYEPSDVEKLGKIHARFYANEFEFPDFLKGFTCAFTIEDEKGIVTTGGVRPILEVIAVTNKDCSVRARHEALCNLLQASSYVARVEGHDQLHAFVQDTKWLSHLLKIGFNHTKGQALVLNV